MIMFVYLICLLVFVTAIFVVAAEGLKAHAAKRKTWGYVLGVIFLASQALAVTFVICRHMSELPL